MAATKVRRHTLDSWGLPAAHAAAAMHGEHGMAPDPTEPAARPAVTPEELRDVFDAQRATALRLRTSTAAQRIARLGKLREAFVARTPQWYQAGQADFGRPPGEMDLTEILPVVMKANQAMRCLRGWMHPRRIWPAFPLSAVSTRVGFEPRGRCLIVSPWSEPLALTLGPLISAIAAGNTAIVKPSELSPHLARAMALLIEDVFPPDEVKLFEGGTETCAALLQLPFDHLFLSGNPASGKAAMEAAATHLASVTLELGGKNPAIIDETADIEVAAQGLLWAKYSNNGQSCTAPDHVLVHDRVRSGFVRRCIEILESTYNLHDQQWACTPHLARVVSIGHGERLKALLDDAVRRGARIRYGGSMSVETRFFAPTLIDQVPLQARINSEEIFGPILPIYGFSDLGDVIDRINHAPRPPVLYLYGNDKANLHRVLTSTSSGSVCVNHAVARHLYHRLPFGGAGPSGLDHSQGRYGFRAFSHERPVVTARIPGLGALLKPGEVPDSLRRALHRLIPWA